MDDHSHLSGGGVGTKEALINEEDPNSPSGAELLEKMKKINVLISDVTNFLHFHLVEQNSWRK